jgi:hypothetical protein
VTLPALGQQFRPSHKHKCSTTELVFILSYCYVLAAASAARAQNGRPQTTLMSRQPEKGTYTQQQEAPQKYDIHLLNRVPYKRWDNISYFSKARSGARVHTQTFTFTPAIVLCVGIRSSFTRTSSFLSSSR